MNAKLSYVSVLGRTLATATAYNVRLTPTLVVIQPRDVRDIQSAQRFPPRFGRERRYARSTLQPFPKRRPLTGNGYWRLDELTEPQDLS